VSHHFAQVERPGIGRRRGLLQFQDPAVDQDLSAAAGDVDRVEPDQHRSLGLLLAHNARPRVLEQRLLLRDQRRPVLQRDRDENG